MAALVRARQHETALARANRKVRMFSSRCVRKSYPCWIEFLLVKTLEVSQDELDKYKIEHSQDRKSSLELSTAQWELGKQNLQILRQFAIFSTHWTHMSNTLVCLTMIQYQVMKSGKAKFVLILALMIGAIWLFINAFERITLVAKVKLGSIRDTVVGNVELMQHPLLN